MTAFAALSFALVALSEALQCKSGQCSLRSVNCTQQPSLCEMTSVGPMVVDFERAKFMCGNESLELVAPGDLTTNQEMKRLCPTAAFFDIEAKQAESESVCNSFVVASSGEPPEFLNWGLNEPNNRRSITTNESCSRGPILEGCAAFLPQSVTLNFLVFFFRFLITFASQNGRTDDAIHTTPLIL